MKAYDLFDFLIKIVKSRESLKTLYKPGIKWNDVSFLTTINSLFMCLSIYNVSFFGFIVKF